LCHHARTSLVGRNTWLINFNILDIWSIVEHDYEPKYNPTTYCLTTESQIEKWHVDYVVNVILNSVSELITLVFGNMTCARDMWLALLNRFESNTQIKDKNHGSWNKILKF
jgi:hypothetical protein